MQSNLQIITCKTSFNSKFRGEIGTLEAEKQELLKELRLAESRSNQIMDEGHTDTLVTLADAKGTNC